MIAVQLLRSGDRSSSLVQLNIAHKVEQTRAMNCSGDGRDQFWFILSSLFPLLQIDRHFGASFLSLNELGPLTNM
jgi:hypothetical protein